MHPLDDVRMKAASDLPFILFPSHTPWLLLADGYVIRKVENMRTYVETTNSNVSALNST